MKKSLVKQLVAVFGMFAVAAIGVAGCHKLGNAEERAAFVHGRLTEKFQLTEHQQQILDRALNSVTAIVKENKSIQKQDLAVLRKNIENGGTVDSEEFMALYTKRRAIIDKHVDQIAASLSELSGTLSPEQRKDVLALIAKAEKHISR